MLPAKDAADKKEQSEASQRLATLKNASPTTSSIGTVGQPIAYDTRQCYVQEETARVIVRQSNLRAAPSPPEASTRLARDFVLSPQ